MISDTHNKLISTVHSGVIYRVSRIQLKLILSGINRWFIPKSQTWKKPKSPKDWKVFFSTDEDFIKVIYTVSNIKSGKFDEMTRSNQKEFKIGDLGIKESLKKYKDWVRGMGGFEKRKRKGKGTYGPANKVVMFILRYKFDGNSIPTILEEGAMYKLITIKETRELFKTYTTNRE